MNIVFMGTPDFAVPSLSKILQAGYRVTAVVTAPDRPAGRGRQLRPSPVKEFAQSHGLKVLQPEKLRDPGFLDELREAAPDLMVVVAFRMLPEAVWSLPSMGTFNLHASLLPDYRGAAPINWAIINGETKSGATTFLIDKEIDTGNLMLQRETEILPSWTAGDLHDVLMEMGAELVLETVQGLENSSIATHAQDESLSRHKAPKIFKEDCRIDWTLPATKVNNLIRGLSPYPTAWTYFQDEPAKIYLARPGQEATAGVLPGSIRLSENREQMFVACANQWLEILSLQMPGKKRLATAEFLRGFKDELVAFS